jgi:hypothetical protein
VDPVTGHIVLGNDTGGVAATLLSNREVPLAGFNIDFTDIGTTAQIFPAGFIASDLIAGTASTLENEGELTLIGNSALATNLPGIRMQDIVAGDVWSFNNTIGALTARNITTPGNFFVLDRIGNIYRLGDLSGTNNTTFINVNDGAQVLQVNAVNGINISGDTVMIHTTTAWTDGAAAAIGTLLNAPVAGNPTKWIPVDDNGTTRFIPSW